jgi:DNA polymerase III epsilon subunit family exonuclease
MQQLTFLGADNAEHNPGNVVTRYTEVTPEIASQLSKRFIAFDVESTGLNTHSDRIVELGAVLFENGKPVSAFSTLVNPGVSMPEKATEICHITDEMLAAAPSEAEVYPDLLRFLGDALTCQTYMCAHNARFDLDMLRHTLVRLGYTADIRYVDTLKISWKCLHGMPNHKQPTLAAQLGITVENAHRAADDALVCGRLLLHMLPLVESSC